MNLGSIYVLFFFVFVDIALSCSKQSLKLTLNFLLKSPKAQLEKHEKDKPEKSMRKTNQRKA